MVAAWPVSWPWVWGCRGMIDSDTLMSSLISCLQRIITPVDELYVCKIPNWIKYRALQWAHLLWHAYMCTLYVEVHSWNHAVGRVPKPSHLQAISIPNNNWARFSSDPKASTSQQNTIASKQFCNVTRLQPVNTLHWLWHWPSQDKTPNSSYRQAGLPGSAQSIKQL